MHRCVCVRVREHKIDRDSTHRDSERVVESERERETEREIQQQ